MASRQEVVAQAVAAFRSAGVPIYRAATKRAPAVSGVGVRLGHRPGTLDVLLHGDGLTFTLDTVRHVLASSGFEEVYVNERGGAVSVRRSKGVQPRRNPAPPNVSWRSVQTARGPVLESDEVDQVHRAHGRTVYRRTKFRIVPDEAGHGVWSFQERTWVDHGARYSSEQAAVMGWIADAASGKFGRLEAIVKKNGSKAGKAGAHKNPGGASLRGALFVNPSRRNPDMGLAMPLYEFIRTRDTVSRSAVYAHFSGYSQGDIDRALSWLDRKDYVFDDGATITSAGWVQNPSKGSKARKAEAYRMEGRDGKVWKVKSVVRGRRIPGYSAVDPLTMPVTERPDYASRKSARRAMREQEHVHSTGRVEGWHTGLSLADFTPGEQQMLMVKAAKGGGRAVTHIGTVEVSATGHIRRVNPSAAVHKARAAHQESLFARTGSEYHRGARDAHRGVPAANPAVRKTGKKAIPHVSGWKTFDHVVRVGRRDVEHTFFAPTTKAAHEYAARWLAELHAATGKLGRTVSLHAR